MAVDHNNPQSRVEAILVATIDGKVYKGLPESRLEELLLELKEVIEEGGGGGGTDDYNQLKNKPTIGGKELEGDMSLEDIGMEALSTQEVDRLIALL